VPAPASSPPPAPLAPLPPFPLPWPEPLLFVPEPPEPPPSVPTAEVESPQWMSAIGTEAANSTVTVATCIVFIGFLLEARGARGARAPLGARSP
jgi:hypothetical protein